MFSKQWEKDDDNLIHRLFTFSKYRRAPYLLYVRTVRLFTDTVARGTTWIDMVTRYSLRSNTSGFLSAYLSRCCQWTAFQLPDRNRTRQFRRVFCDICRSRPRPCFLTPCCCKRREGNKKQLLEKANTPFVKE